MGERSEQELLDRIRALEDALRRIMVARPSREDQAWAIANNALKAGLNP